MYFFFFGSQKNHVLRALIFSGFWKFCENLFLRMVGVWKFWFYIFQPKRNKNQEKTLESRDFGLFLINRKRGSSRWRNCSFWLILKKDGSFVLRIMRLLGWFQKLVFFFFVVTNTGQNMQKHLVFTDSFSYVEGQNHRLCISTEEYGKVKTHIIAYFMLWTSQKKWSVPLRISSVNVTKSRDYSVLQWKTFFLVQWKDCVVIANSYSHISNTAK